MNTDKIIIPNGPETDYPGEFVMPVGPEKGLTGHIFAELESFLDGSNGWFALFPASKYDEEMDNGETGVTLVWEGDLEKDEPENVTLLHLEYLNGRGFENYLSMIKSRDAFEKKFGINAFLGLNEQLIRILRDNCDCE